MAAAGPAQSDSRPALGNARRLYLYVMAFAGLMTIAAALNSLASLVIQQFMSGGSTILSAGDTRQRASFYLAALIVGLPVWLGHWLAANRAAGRIAGERQAAARRGFLAATLLVAAIVVLTGLHQELTFLFTISLPPALHITPRSAAETGFRLLLFAAVGLVHLRIAIRESAEPAAPAVDELRDFALYAVTACALGFLLAGAIQLLNRATAELLHVLAHETSAVILNSSDFAQASWGMSAAWLLSGGLMWAALCIYDRRRREPHRWRTVYLYLVLIIAVPFTLGTAVQVAYELLRLSFGYRPESGTWDFLKRTLSVLLVGSAVWLYHWRAVKAQAAFREPEPDVVFARPRRLGIVLLALLGLFAAAPSFASLLWVGFDWVFQSSSTLSGHDWWRDRTSFGLAAAIIGGVVWLRAWMMMQRAAAISPAVEGNAKARRTAIALVVIVGALVALGFVVAALWLVFQIALGEPFTPSRQSLLVNELSSMVVAGGVALYHAVVLRAAGGLRRAAPLRRRLMVLTTPGAEAALAQIRDMEGIQVQLMGHLAGAPPAESDLAALKQLLQALGLDGEPARALLILHPDGGSLYPFTDS